MKPVVFTFWPEILRFSAAAALILSGLSLVIPASAADWPVFRHDAARSGATEDPLEVSTLGRIWTYRAAAPPLPAWTAPARWDAGNSVRNLRSMRNYDPVFHSVVAGGSVFFGSSADDTVTCLDSRTGERRWSFKTGGPVRIAPTVADERVYFGSDDGFAYCLNSADGSLRWKLRPHEDATTVLHNGRPISQFPIRTGVVVADGTAYFAASLFPWNKSFLAAVDAATGKADGTGRYLRPVENVVLEGPPVIAPRGLIIPQGRSAPLLFAREDGGSLGTLGQTGGCFLLLDGQGKMLHAPGNRQGGMLAVDARTGTRGAVHPRAHLAAARGDMTWLVDDTSVSAIHTTQGVAWRKPCGEVFEIIAAGSHVAVGGDDEVRLLDAATGESVWRQPVFGRAYGLAVADGKLFVSTEEGQITCFAAGGDRSFRPPELVAPEKQPAAPATQNIVRREDPNLLGRWSFDRSHVDDATTTVEDLAGRSPGKIIGRAEIQTTGSFSALVFNGRDTGVLLAPQFREARIPTAAISAEAWVRVDHKPEWGGLIGILQDNGAYERGWILGYRKDRFYFAVAAEQGGGKLTYLSAAEPLIQGEWAHVVGTYDGERMRLYVDGRLAGESKEQQGKLHYPPRAEYFLGGYKDENEHYPLAGQIHEVRVYDRALTPAEIAAHDAEKPARPRSLLPAQRLDTFALAAGPVLRFTGPTTARVEWSTRLECPTKLEHLADGRVQQWEELSPKLNHAVELTGLRRNRLTHYRLQIGDGETLRSSDMFECDTHHNYTAFMRTDASPKRDERPVGAGEGSWTHMYGRPDNSAFGGETLGGVTKSEQLEVAWFGPPGPRFQIDRQNRKPSPLAVNGRLFAQGFGRVIALDARTGIVEWELEMPNVRRLNIPRDCSNWCVDEEFVYIAAGDRCEVRRQTDGAAASFAELSATLGAEESADRDWGYVARSGEMLVGGSVLRGSHYTDWWGWDQWWDDPPGNKIVCSDCLFAANVRPLQGRPPSDNPHPFPQPSWTYRGGTILNPTITIAEDTVYFVESRSAALQGRRTGRFGDELWSELRLVALDLSTGKERWSKAIEPQAGKSAFYLAHGDRTLTLVSSGQGTFEVTTFSATAGEVGWKKTLPWESNHHGKHLSRPALVGGRLILRPHVLDLQTGNAIYTKFPAGHTCASYVCTTDAVFLRATELTAWDLKTNAATRFPRLRPDCWISTIPACGMLLSPEGGGGCSCGTWLETSIGFRPK